MRRVLAALPLALLLTQNADSGPAPTAATEVTELREGPGRDLTVGRCIVCHSVEYIPSNAPAMNRAGWQKSIQKMKDRFGAPITDEEAKQILDYLDANYSGKTG
ncbi:MAG: cytochrome c [Gammaproteobacteria bacterium]|nr:cytochrome c [Gammaproteobacteria bacterium]